MAMVDVQASLPFMLIALAVLAFFGSSFTLFIFVMGIYGWEVFARLTRGMVISANHARVRRGRRIAWGQSRANLRSTHPSEHSQRFDRAVHAELPSDNSARDLVEFSWSRHQAALDELGADVGRRSVASAAGVVALGAAGNGDLPDHPIHFDCR